VALIPIRLLSCNYCTMKISLYYHGFMAKISRALPHLSEDELLAKIANAPSARIQQKWTIVYNALVAPRAAIDIAKHTATSLRTVHQVISNYNRMGVAAIETVGRGGRYNSYMSVEEEERFLEPFAEMSRKGSLTTIQPIRQAFEEKVGHEVHHSTIYELLKRHGWRKLVPRPYHPEGDKEAQADFLENFSQLVEEAQKDRAADDKRPVVLMAQDEGRFGRLGQVMRSWAAAKIRPEAPQQLIREYLYAYVAVAPSLGMMTALVLPYSNTDMMNLFLEQVAQDFVTSFLIIQMDGASYHHSKELIVPENIRLIFQPARSAELNPAEHVWEEVREKNFYNRAFDSLKDVSDTLCKGLKDLMDLPEKIKSMTNFPHMRIAF
jgi:transposase